MDADVYGFDDVVGLWSSVGRCVEVVWVVRWWEFAFEWKEVLMMALGDWFV